MKTKNHIEEFKKAAANVPDTHKIMKVILQRDLWDGNYKEFHRYQTDIVDHLIDGHPWTIITKSKISIVQEEMYELKSQMESRVYWIVLTSIFWTSIILGIALKIWGVW